MNDKPPAQYPNDPTDCPVSATPLVSDDGKMVCIREEGSKSRWIASTVYYRLSIGR